MKMKLVIYALVVWLIIGVSYCAIFYSNDYSCDEMSIAMHSRLSEHGIKSYYAGYLGHGDEPSHVWIVVCAGDFEIPFETTNGVGIPTHSPMKYMAPDVVFTTTDEMLAFDQW